MSITINKKTRTGSLTLTAGHSLVLGHKPDNLTFEAINEKLLNTPTAEIVQFGLFDNATPNYATYYPDVTAEDLAPKEEDFIYPIYRMLSEVIVSKGAPIDFSKKGVLKNSMQKLLGQTINIDHEMAVGNAIGAIMEVYWQNSYKDKSGIQVPAGINAKLKIDGKSNPRIARGIMMSPPSIHSNSVTVKFEWEQSHTFEEEGMFWEKLGSYTKSGELIRLVVSNISAYHETSLVSHGADPFAQKIEDGKIVNPSYSRDNYSFSIDKPTHGTLNFDYKDDKSILYLDNSIPYAYNNNNSNPNEKSEMKEILEKLITELGFDEGALTEENLVSELKTKFDTLEDNAATLQSEKEALETTETELNGTIETQKAEITRLEGEVNSHKDNNTLLTEFTENTRKEAVKFYKLSKGDEVDESILTLIEGSEIKAAKAFLAQYEKEVEDKFAPSCNACSSTDINRFSAKTPDTEGDDDKTKNFGKEKKTNQEVRQSLKDKRRKASRLFKN